MFALLCAQALAAEAMVVVGEDIQVAQGDRLLSVEQFALYTGDEMTWRRVERQVDVQNTVRGVGLGAGLAVTGVAGLTGGLLNGAGRQDAALVAFGIAGTSLGVAGVSELWYRRLRRETSSYTAWYAPSEVFDRVDAYNEGWGVETPVVRIEDSRSGFDVTVDGRRVDAHEAALQLGDLRTWRRLHRRKVALITGTWFSAHAATVTATFMAARIGWGAAPYAVAFLGTASSLAILASVPRDPMPHQVWDEDEARALAGRVSSSE